MTDWDPALYLKFEQERTRPAIDLLARISNENPRTCVDLGCGPGNSTELLVNRFPKANITGLDQSPGMLAAAKLRLPHVDFEQIDLTHWRPSKPYDGCLAVHMPDTVREPMRALMRMDGKADAGSHIPTEN